MSISINIIIKDSSPSLWLMFFSYIKDPASNHVLLLLFSPITGTYVEIGHND